MNPPALWPVWFVLTVTLEAAVLLALPRPKTVTLKRALKTLLVLNLITHPLVWFVGPHLGLGLHATVLVIETFAVMVETIGYRIIGGWAEAIRASCLANATSFLGGLLLSAAWLR